MQLRACLTTDSERRPFSENSPSKVEATEMPLPHLTSAEAKRSPIHTRVEHNSDQYRRIARLGRSGAPYQPIQYGLGLQNPRLPARIVGRHSSMEL
jgi:hypothetical protein